MPASGRARDTLAVVTRQHHRRRTQWLVPSRLAPGSSRQCTPHSGLCSRRRPGSRSQRLAACTQRRTEVHDGLCVVGDRRFGVCPLCSVPQFASQALSCPASLPPLRGAQGPALRCRRGSRGAARNASARIAPAVELPIPGSSTTSSSSSGNSPRADRE